jgi:SAM-dependent methyltransferase
MSGRLDPATRRRIAENRRNWDARVRVHADSPYYSLTERAAETRFHPREWEQLGPLDGRSVLHLQCHNGAETLAFAQKGARTTGLDFSGGNLAVARRSARAAGVSVDFVEADVYDAVTALDGRTFDLVYTGRGSLPYLPDLDEWARVVARLLEPGGLVGLMEYHPLLNSLGRTGPSDPERPLELRHDYLGGGGPLTFDTPHTYAPSRSGLLVEGATVSHEWPHTVVDVLHALHGAGLAVDLDLLWETDWLDWPRWDGMTRVAPGWWRRPEGGISIPLMYTAGARGPTAATATS